MVSHFKQGLAVFHEPDTNLQGFINKRGEVVLEATYTMTTMFNDHGQAIVRKEQSQVYVINEHGDVVIDEALEIHYTSLGYYVKKSNGYRFVDIKGVPFTDNVFDSVSLIKIESPHLYRSDDKVLDARGNIIFEGYTTQNHVFEDSGDFYLTHYQDDSTLIESVEESFTINIERVIRVRGDLIVGEIGGLTGVIDFDNTVIIPFENQGIFSTDDNFIVVYSEDSLYSFYDLDGNKVTQEEYNGRNSSLYYSN